MKQISIVVENKPGILAELTDIMAKNSINIENLDVETAGNYGIIIMSVDRYDLALKKLRDASFKAISEDCLLIKLKDEPGSLAKIAKRFGDADINIRSLHIISRDGNNSIAAISTERTAKAMDLVKDILIS